MVDFVLDYLCRPTGKGFYASLKLGGLPLYFDGFIAFARTGATEQRKTTFLRII